MIRKFLRNAGAAFFLMGVGALLTLALNVWLARLLGVKDFGTLGVATAVGGVLGLITTFGLHNGALRFISEYQEAGKLKLLKGFLFGSVALVAFASTVIAIAAMLFWMWMEPTGEHDWLGVSAALVVSYAMAMLFGRIARGLGDISGALWPEQILFPVAAMLATFLVADSGFWIIILAYIGARYLGVFAGGFVAWRAMPANLKDIGVAEFDWIKWGSVSVPLLAGALVHALFQKADTAMVGGLSSLDEAGLYTAVSKVSLTLSFILGVVEAAVAPLLANAYHGKRWQELRRLFWLSTMISGAAGLALFLVLIFNLEFVLQLFGEGFVAAKTALAILLVGQFLNAATGPAGYLLMVAGREKLYARAMLVAGFGNLLLNVLLIPDFGAAGAAVATAISLGGVMLAMFLVAVLGVLGYGRSLEID